MSINISRIRRLGSDMPRLMYLSRHRVVWFHLGSRCFKRPSNLCRMQSCQSTWLLVTVLSYLNRVANITWTIWQLSIRTTITGWQSRLKVTARLIWSINRPLQWPKIRVRQALARSPCMVSLPLRTKLGYNRMYRSSNSWESAIIITIIMWIIRIRLIICIWAQESTMITSVRINSIQSVISTLMLIFLWILRNSAMEASSNTKTITHNWT